MRKKGKESTARELTGENQKNLKGRCWGVLHTDQNRESHARGRNSRERVECQPKPQMRQGLKVLGEESAIRIMSLNIRSVWAEGLDAALRALQQGNIGVVILQETNLTDMIYTRHSAGYVVWVTEAKIRRREGGDYGGVVRGGGMEGRGDG